MCSPGDVDSPKKNFGGIYPGTFPTGAILWTDEKFYFQHFLHKL